MKAEAVIFDKDGTLIDFDAFWIGVSVAAVSDVLKKLGRADIPAEEILCAYGVNGNTVDIDSILCKGTYEQLGQLTWDILQKYGCPITRDEAVKIVLDAFNSNMDAGVVKPTCPELKQVLTKLKDRGIKLAVVTTDNTPITHLCLDKLGITALFDTIYTDDGIAPAKPDPWCAEDFLRRNGIGKDRAVMVGDTMTDVRFARNAGIGVVGVAPTEQGRLLLAPHADALVTDLSALLTLLA